jgi:hypothetical protein
MKYVLYKIKDNKLDQWTDWCNLLKTEHRVEALKTLSDENVLFEGFTTFKIGESFYAFGFYFENTGGERPVNKENVLNKKHSAIKKECLEFVSKGESDYFVSLG